MATSAYITGRKRYQRPQSVLWSENSGTLSNGLYVPNGYEIGTDPAGILNTSLLNQFLILSDHNRSEIKFSKERIEQRKRTVNGRMRSYHIADKNKIDISWERLPSRNYYQNAAFNPNTGISPYKNQSGEFTADGGAGGVQLLDWYENHPGPFWMFLAYDKYDNFKQDGNIVNNSFIHLGEYNEIIQVYFSNFEYDVVSRGGSNHDLWNVSVSLEEV